MGWRILVFYPERYNSTNTVAYFYWKMVIYIYVCGQCRTQFMLPNSGRLLLINMNFYRVSGISIIRYAQWQHIGKQNNLKVLGARKRIGLCELWSHMPEDGQTFILIIIKQEYIIPVIHVNPPPRIQTLY
jgi:hypothetical protein